MKRTILFRGKRIDNNEWAIGYYWVDNTNGKHKITTNLSDDNFTCHEINPETLGQYTEHNDISGTFIYDGDIIVYDYYPYYNNGKLNHVDVIEFIHVAWQGVKICINKDLRGISDGINEYLNYDGNHNMTCRLIGNIYDNPEFLKEQ